MAYLLLEARSYFTCDTIIQNNTPEFIAEWKSQDGTHFLSDVKGFQIIGNEIKFDIISLALS